MLDRARDRRDIDPTAAEVWTTEPGRVLIVDDDPDIASILAMVVREAGHDVTIASDGEEALTAILEQPPEVVVTDLRMPRLDGAGLLQQIRQRHLDVEVIILTANTSLGAAVTTLREYGAFDFLTKPLDDVD